jgi:hypothetical protein
MRAYREDLRGVIESNCFNTKGGGFMGFALDAQVRELIEKVKRYEKALEFYAYDASSLSDEGETARKALEK